MENAFDRFINKEMTNAKVMEVKRTVIASLHSMNQIIKSDDMQRLKEIEEAISEKEVNELFSVEVKFLNAANRIAKSVEEIMEFRKYYEFNWMEKSMGLMLIDYVIWLGDLMRQVTDNAKAGKRNRLIIGRLEYVYDKFVGYVMNYLNYFGELVENE